MPSPDSPRPETAEHHAASRLPWPRRSALAVLTALAVAVSLLAVPSPADAHAATGSWRNFHTICNGCTVDEGNLIRFWQSLILGSYGGNYYNMNCSFVDGSFGPNTRDWTERMQRFLGVDDDGIVGYDTWNAAASHLELVSTGDSSNVYRWHESANPAFGSGWRVHISYYKSTGYWRFFDHCGPDEYVYLNHE